MNGAESALRTAQAAGIELCLANPGTTEMPLVAALDAVPGVRAVLGLFEGVCTGAADGYARMTGRPALTLLHLGPGFANGIANLHNARRARVPVVNWIGDQARWHLAADAPLTSDIASLARPVSGFVRTTSKPAEFASDTAAAIAAAWGPPGQVASLIVPVDCQAEEAPGPAPAPRRPTRALPDQTVIDAARAAVSRGRAALLLGGDALSERGQRAAARIAAATGTRLVCETFWRRLERGAGLPMVERLPYFPEQAIEFLGAFDDLILVGSLDPVAFFGMPGLPSRLAPEGCAVHALADPAQDAEGALEAVAEALGAPASAPTPAISCPSPASGALDTGSLGQTLAALLPEDAIVVDEGATSGLPFFLAGAAAARHSVLALTGGAIGQGPPCATGAALACPDRRVVCLQADGSGMYTLQALWTQARESLDVTTVVCANRSYRILQIELGRAGIAEPGPQALAMTDLTRPELDWVALAKGLGVPGERVESADALARALEASFREPGPRLIEALL